MNPPNVKFYTFSYKNPVRAEHMRTQFAAENLSLEFVKPVEADDPRLQPCPEIYRRSWAIMFNHLDMLSAFLASDATHGIFCEDDICLRKGIRNYLTEVVYNFDRFNLEILLLSYLTTHIPVTFQTHPQHSEYDIPFTYLTYYPDVWGAHMYMLNKASAQMMLNIFTQDYAVRSLTDTSLSHFSPDWTITKHGRRALIYPMLGLEKGEVNTDHEGQASFHKQCHDIHFHPDKFYE